MKISQQLLQNSHLKSAQTLGTTTCDRHTLQIFDHRYPFHGQDCNLTCDQDCNLACDQDWNLACDQDCNQGCDQPFNQIARQQKGATLFISLVILLIVTLLAASSLTSTNFQQRMALNTEAENIAFNASESAVNSALNNTPVLLLSINAPAGTFPELTLDLDDSRVVATAEVEHKSTSIAPGFSLGLSSGSYVAYKFEVRGTGSIGSLKTQSNTTQGVYKIAPGS
ncbi:MAG: hypothetical protein KUG79_11005 [Pseudomonadales bacterium]|nr:hypothetical protein [Pseudomonadales bacterium]